MMRLTGIGPVVVLAAVLCSLRVPVAQANPDGTCTDGAHATGDSITVSIDCSVEPMSASALVSSNASGEAMLKYLDYEWRSPCANFDASVPAADAPDCGLAHVCANPRERSWNLWGLIAETRSWDFITSRCFGAAPTAADLPRPRITPALVLNEIRRIGLPELRARTQPEGKTLVNFDTIFYTEAQPFTATVTLLGQQVDIVAEATEYTWHHGDGSTAATSSPGAPYPSKEITYRYSDAHTTVRPRVDVTYTARFRVNGGPWQDIDETVTITGPEGSLRVSEAAPVLSGNYE